MQLSNIQNEFPPPVAEHRDRMTPSLGVAEIRFPRGPGRTATRDPAATEGPESHLESASRRVRGGIQVGKTPGAAGARTFRAGNFFWGGGYGPSLAIVTEPLRLAGTGTKGKPVRVTFA